MTAHPTADQTPGETWTAGPKDAITDVPGIRVGHWTDRRGATGCTVILCETAVAAAVDARGGAPGSRETDVLALSNLVRTCHAVVLTGGSAFGLASASGVMRFLAEREIGFVTPHRAVPIVSAAVLYDLGIGDPRAFPGDEAGYRAARAARRGHVREGSIGAGTGATVAKMLGPERMLKSGIGTASVSGPNGLIVGAIAAANALGSIYDPSSGECIAGPRDDDGAYLPLPEVLVRRRAAADALLENTTLICVATNARLTPDQLQRITYHAHDGLARVVRPVHTIADGDIAFALSMGTNDDAAPDLLAIGVLAQHAVERALLRSVRMAGPLAGIPAIHM